MFVPVSVADERRTYCWVLTQGWAGKAKVQFAFVPCAPNQAGQARLKALSAGL